MPGHEITGPRINETDVAPGEQLRWRELVEKVHTAVVTFPHDLLLADRNTAMLQTADEQWVRVFFLGDYRFLPASADIPTGLFIGLTDGNAPDLYEFGPSLVPHDKEKVSIEGYIETLRKLELKTLTFDELELAELLLEGPSRASRQS